MKYKRSLPLKFRLISIKRQKFKLAIDVEQFSRNNLKCCVSDGHVPGELPSSDLNKNARKQPPHNFQKYKENHLPEKKTEFFVNDP